MSTALQRMKEHRADLFFVSLLLVFGVALSALLFAPTSAFAQEEDYEEWLEQQQQEFEEYLSEQDKAFLKFLDQQWKDVRVDSRATSPIDDKPRKAPRVDESRLSSEGGQPPEASSEPQESRVTEPSSAADASSEDSSPSDAEPISEEEESLGEEGDSFTQSQASPSQNETPIPDEQAAEPSAGSPTSEGSGAQPSGAASSGAAELDQEAEISFFGASATVPYGSALLPRLQGDPGPSTIQTYWKSMAQAPYRPMLDALQKQRREMSLSDWGYYLYLRRLGTQLYGEEDGGSTSIDATLWTWFMLMKSGFGVRVGYQDREVFLMLPVDEQIFDRPQMHIDGQRYYLMTSELGGESLRTYEGGHPEADRVLQMDEGTVPRVSTASEKRSVSFTFQGDRYQLDVAYNSAVIDYLEAYPNVELSVLLGSGVSPEAQQSLEETLAPVVNELAPREAVNFLLKFAQFSTQYKRDRDHFGKERFLFPEEMLATDYSDCEDRAVLLAYLVRSLLDREIVGLKWPRHVALAVRAGKGLEVRESDRHVTVEGRPYIFADPTYIGSSMGMEMPIIEGTQPEIVNL